MAEKKDCYALLEVPKTATADEIKKAYYKLSAKYHPDRLLRKTPEEQKAGALMFSQITEAKDILLDPAKKQAYDVGGHDSVERMGKGGGGSGNSVNVGSVVRQPKATEADLRSFFGAGSATSKPRPSTSTSSTPVPPTRTSGRETMEERAARRKNGGRRADVVTTPPVTPDASVTPPAPAPAPAAPTVSTAAQVAVSQVSAALDKLSAITDNDLSSLSLLSLQELSRKLDTARTKAGAAALRVKSKGFTP